MQLEEGTGVGAGGLVFGVGGGGIGKAVGE